MRLHATLLTLALLLTGCIGGLGGGDEPPADPPVTEEPVVETASTENEAPPAAANANASASPPASPPPSNASAPAPPASPPAPAPRVDVLQWDGTVTAVGAYAQTPAGGVCCPRAEAAGENVQGTIEIPAGAKGIVVELAWGDPTFDLDLLLDAPDVTEPVPPDPAAPGRSGHWWIASNGGPAVPGVGAPDGHATIVITDAEALALTGTWTWSVQPKGPANEVAFRVAASVFLDAPPAEGYSALATPSDNP